MYAASSGGKVFVWDAVSHQIEPTLNLNCQLESFDLHSALPIAAFGRLREQPILWNTNNVAVLGTARSVEPGSIFAFHPILPTITFGLTSGHVVSYDITLLQEPK
jgi:hypothetical protein